MKCDHRFEDARGRRVYLNCQSCGMIDPHEERPIPAPGFYWAKKVPGEAWSVVEVTEYAWPACGRMVYGMGQSERITVAEWGDWLEPPA